MTDGSYSTFYEVRLTSYNIDVHGQMLYLAHNDYFKVYFHISLNSQNVLRVLLCRSSWWACHTMLFCDLVNMLCVMAHKQQK